jgi:hypothetical protein
MRSRKPPFLTYIISIDNILLIARKANEKENRGMLKYIGVRDFNNPPDRSLITAMSCIDVHGFFHIFHWKKALFYG